MAPLAPLVWNDLRGLNSADPATRLPAWQGTDAHNILLEPMSLGRRRPSTDTFLSHAEPIYQMVRFQPANEKGGAYRQLFFFYGAAAAGITRYANGSTYAVTLSDTVAAFGTSRPYAVTHNGKLFVAYNSNVNRLHVYDPNFSTSGLRRVGLESSAAATVADTGAGAYAATLRYYKIQWKIINGSDTVATSELSASVSFTPSGAGTAARVTKPTTPDSATHWIVFGSADNVTYYQLSSDIVVATTTYDDSAAISTYSNNAVAPTDGLSVPPPSAKFLLSDGNRLLMAGAWETTATSKQTAVKNNRVWFTDVNGARNQTGEDESIPQSTDTKSWIDVGENDGEAVTGLAGPLDGNVYVFKDRSIWRLSPTGLIDSPYRADRISSVLGATWQDGITMGEDGQGNPAIYFMSYTGPKRITQGYGIEEIGPDVRATTTAVYTSVDDTPIVLWDQVRRVLWWFTYGARSAYAFQPQFEERTKDGVRGGWTRHTIAIDPSQTATYGAILYETSGDVLVPYLCGLGQQVLGVDRGVIASLSTSVRHDVGQVAFTPSVTSAPFQSAGAGRRFRVGPPILEWQYPGAAVNHAVTLTSAIGGPTSVSGSSSGTTSTSLYSQSLVQETLESVRLSDLTGVQITITWDTTVDGTERPRIHAITLPIDTEGRA